MAEIPVVNTRPATTNWRTDTRQPETGSLLRPSIGWPAASRFHARKASAGWITRHLNHLRFADSVAVIGSVFLGYLGSQPGISAEGLKDDPATAAAVLAASWLAGLELYRTRDVSVLGVGADEYKRVASATLRIFGLMALVAVVFSIGGASHFITVSLPLGLVSLTLSRRAFRRRLSTEKAMGRHLSRVVVAGEPEDVRYVVQQVSRKCGAVYDILGVCLPEARPDAALIVDGRSVPVLSSTDVIARTACAVDANSVIIAGPLPGGNKFIRELGWELEESYTGLILAATLTNVAGPRIHWRPVEGLPLMHVDIPQYTGAKHALKRAMDVTGALAALVLLSPLLLMLAVIVKLSTPGPVLFRQDRIGKDGQVFGMYKFRSMVVDAEARLSALSQQNQAAGVLFKIKDDPRITGCGHWMRKYSLDELPQLWNVVLGDMSLVGPRPPLDREVSNYERHTRRRLLIKPGITGLWQINGRSDLPWEEAVRLDLYYVENWSIAGDLLIMWRTLRAVVRSSGAY